jgi:hypothetical protein
VEEGFMSSQNDFAELASNESNERTGVYYSWVFSVLVAFVFVEVEYVIELTALFRHHVYLGIMSPAWIFELLILLSIGCYFRALGFRGILRVEGKFKQFSAKYFFFAFFTLILSILEFRDLITAAVKANYGIAP